MVQNLPGFDSWVEKTPWRREWLPTPVFLPGESRGQRSLADYSLWDLQRVEHGGVITDAYVYACLSIRV